MRGLDLLDTSCHTVTIRCVSDRKAASAQHRSASTRSTARAVHPDLAGEADPNDFERMSSPKVLVATPVQVRRRIRDTLKQLHAIIHARVQNASRPHDTATEQGVVDEIKALAEAKRCGTASDKRGARLALAATLVLLAERDDRPVATDTDPNSMRPSLLRLPDVA